MVGRKKFIFASFRKLFPDSTIIGSQIAFKGQFHRLILATCMKCEETTGNTFKKQGRWKELSEDGNL